ncbi:uncharacterized protein LOC122877061 [Siniperca chuatsi]|uniref:uncharacterized protein LOC122877061 n=1 Tax=Siniperca chuatsi TaxID=119488 RepID=UPI001CE22A2D|nr:uncharacterized protein LOC122877061 [Siniperca chuatsi]
MAELPASSLGPVLWLVLIHPYLPSRPRNKKPDALSQQFTNAASSSDPETILPASCMVGAVTCNVESLVRDAQQTQPSPGNTSPNRLFVPDFVRSQVLQWAHTSQVSCHPGISRTLALLKHSVAPEAAFLVVHHGCRLPCLHLCLNCLCSHLGLPPTSCWPPPPTTGSWSTLVPYHPRLHYWTSPFPRPTVKGSEPSKTSVLPFTVWLSGNPSS